MKSQWVKAVCTILSAAILVVGLNEDVYGLSAREIFDSYALDSGDICSYAIGTGEKVTVGVEGVDQDLYTNFRINPNNGQTSSNRVEITNKGQIRLNIYANTFKHASDKSPKVVTPTKFKDWSLLNSLETESNIAFGLNLQYSGGISQEEESLLDGKNADFWFDDENYQSRVLIATLAPNESVNISINSRFGKNWSEKSELKYHSSLYISRDEEEYQCEILKLIDKAEFLKELEYRLKEDEEDEEIKVDSAKDDEVNYTVILDSGEPTSIKK